MKWGAIVNTLTSIKISCTDVSSHLIFSIYIEAVMRKSDIDDMGIKIGGRNLTNLRYAEDTALLANDVTSI